MNSYFQSAPINRNLSPFCQKQRPLSAYRKYIAYTIFLLSSFFFCVSPTQAEGEAGYVITTDNGQVYLNLGTKHGIETGMLFSVYRPLFNVYRPKENAAIDIGKIKVTQVSSEASVASILSQKGNMEIMAGDRIEIIQPERKSENQLALPQLTLPKSGNKFNNHKIRWLFLETGIVALGSAGYFYQLADKAYSKYKRANSSDEALSHRKETELNDKRAKIALGASLALISISAYLWQRETVKKHDSFISFLSSHLEPYNYNEIRLGAKF